MPESEGYLAEYQELRAEIRHYLERRAQSISVVLLITTAVAGFAPSAKNGFLVPTAALLVAFLWYDETRRMRAVHRVAAYLRLYVEPRIPELLWETRAEHHPVRRELLSRAIANGVFPLAYAILVGLMIERDGSFEFSQPLPLVGIALGVLLLVLSVLQILTGPRREEENWAIAEAQRLAESRS